MIGGNVYGTIQIKTTEKNEYGERVTAWKDSVSIFGWLDLQTGTANYTDTNAKIQDSTHVFICDYQDLDGITAETARMMVEGRYFSIQLIDNPMELNEQLEIYLKYQDGESE